MAAYQQVVTTEPASNKIIAEVFFWRVWGGTMDPQLPQWKSNPQRVKTDRSPGQWTLGGIAVGTTHIFCRSGKQHGATCLDPVQEKNRIAVWPKTTTKAHTAHSGFDSCPEKVVVSWDDWPGLCSIAPHLAGCTVPQTATTTWESEMRWIILGALDHFSVSVTQRCFYRWSLLLVEELGHRTPASSEPSSKALWKVWGDKPASATVGIIRLLSSIQSRLSTPLKTKGLISRAYSFN